MRSNDWYCFPEYRRVDLITGAHHQSPIHGLDARCKVPCSMTIAEGVPRPRTAYHWTPWSWCGSHEGFEVKTPV